METKPKTNADRIREMSDEELADILYRACVAHSCNGCPVEQLCNETFRTTNDWFDWLESEAEE